MLNPGSYTLLSRQLTTAVAGEAQTPADKLAGIRKHTGRPGPSVIT